MEQQTTVTQWIQDLCLNSGPQNSYLETLPMVIVRNFREIEGEQKALRHDKSLSLRLDLPPLLRDC